MCNCWKSQFPPSLSLSLSLPEETDGPGALESEGYSPSAFLAGVHRIFNVCQYIINGIRNALMALTFPLIIPVKPPNADPTSVSGTDPFISVPMHPRKDIIMCIAPGLRITSLNMSNSHHFIFCPTM